MCSTGTLREFIVERLTAAATDIFSVFEQTIVRYEEEIDRQRRLLDIGLKPRISLTRIDVAGRRESGAEPHPQNSECERMDTNQEEPEPSQIKEEQAGLNQTEGGARPPPADQEQLEERQPVVLKQESNSFNGTQTSERQEQPGTLTEVTSHKSAAEKRRGRCQRQNKNKATTFPPRNNVGSVLSVGGFNKNPRVCGKCGKTFSSKRYVMIHMRTHTGERPFVCSTCGKGYIRRQHLTAHKATHASLPAVTCKTCGKTFRTFRYLYSHMLIHNKEKPYSCQTCGKGFHHQCGVWRHSRTHTRERPFSCNICGKTYMQPSHLATHKATHTGRKRFSCKTCDKAYFYQSDLLRHKKISHP